MINFGNVSPGTRILELGGGANRHPQVHCNVDARQVPGVDFTADFDKPLPIQDNEWDVVLAQYVIEHLSWRSVRQFIVEVFRILKVGGTVVVTTANTEAQFNWLKDHPEGWDGKESFDSFSCIIFGDQDYPENTHKNFMSPTVAMKLFQEAGFENITVSAYGERNTDMSIQARKINTNVLGSNVVRADAPVVISDEKSVKKVTPSMNREEMFDKHYFNGGKKVGGYANEGYWDYPVHEITTAHILARKPESVLELGCARGYILKRIQDTGIRGHGLEISKHCYLTRAADNIVIRDVCKEPFTTGIMHDLCYSVAVLEHIPEQYLPHVIKEMQRTCKRGLHGIDFGHKDDGFDKTHTTLRPKGWWQSMFNYHAPNWPVEIVDKEELERGEFPAHVLKGDGKVKLNIGSFTCMYHNAWTNIDIHPLQDWAKANSYNFLQGDVRTGLPFQTNSVDLISSSHMLEHLSYREGLAFLRDCRRVLKHDGAMRIAVPDAELLMTLYANDPNALREMDEINDNAAASPTAAGKLWALLHDGHQACYDGETLIKLLGEAGFFARKSSFRSIGASAHPGLKQIIRETIDGFPCLSLYVDAVPNLG